MQFIPKLTEQPFPVGPRIESEYLEAFDAKLEAFDAKLDTS